MLMPTVLTPKVLLSVNAIQGILGSASIVLILMNAYQNHVMPMPAVLTPKDFLPVSAIVGILEMALIVPTLMNAF